MAEDTTDLRTKAERLRALHHGELLVLPNVWDAGSARVVVGAGARAVATASAAIAEMLGHLDGEGAPWPEMFDAARRVVRAVEVPVTVDAEAGYGMPPRELVDRLLAVGAAGCNLEDTDHRAGRLRDAEVQAERLAAVRSATADAGVPLVINARIDTFLPASAVADEHRLGETIRRGRLYRDAGADCLYPIGVSRRADLATLVTELPGLLNANPGDELDLAALRQLGVARVSFGPRFYRSALADLDVRVRALLRP